MNSSRRATLATPPYPVTEDLHRSCHTLSGTAKTAGARQGIKIAEPLNRYVRKLYDNSIGMPAAGLAVLKDATAAIQQVVDHIEENTGFFLDHPRIAARLGELEHELDEEISRLAETVDATMHSPAFAPAAALAEEATAGRRRAGADRRERAEHARLELRQLSAGAGHGGRWLAFARRVADDDAARAGLPRRSDRARRSAGR